MDVAIVGGGQSGLATSWFLKQAGVDHVVLEAGRIAETWRSRRWDSFCLVTPNWSVKLPGGHYPGPAPVALAPGSSRCSRTSTTIPRARPKARC